MATRPGERLSVPGYGSPDPLFSGVDAGAVQATVAAWEPRADLNELDVVVNRDGSVDVTMNVGG